MAKELTCEIEEVYGFLNPEHTLVYCRVSWNNRKAKDEIRRCEEDKDGKLQLKKGIAITHEEIETLWDAVCMPSKADKGSYNKVNFDDIFSASEGIMEKRDAGYRTKDGFIVVERKNPRKDRS